MWELHFNKWPPAFVILPQLLAAIYAMMGNYLSKEGEKQQDMYDILTWMDRPAKDEDLTEEEKKEKREKHLITKIQISKRMYLEEKARRQKEEEEQENN